MKTITSLKLRTLSIFLISFTINLNTQAQAPSVAAPSPTAAAADVISMYCDTYTNVAVNTWLTSWSAGNTSTLQIAGNETRLYTNLDFVGIETTGANMINISSMTKFHVNAYTPNMTKFRIKLVDWGANGVYQGTPNDDKEHELEFTPIQNGWNSFDINLTSFTGLTTKNHIAQLIFSGNPTGTGTLYIDNVYFSKPALANGISDLSFENTLNIFPNPSNGNITVKFENSTSKNISIKVINLLGEVVYLTNSYLNESTTIDLSNLANGFYHIQINCDGKIATKKIIIKQ